MNKKGQMAGWGAFIALAIFLLLWSVVLGVTTKVNTNLAATTTTVTPEGQVYGNITAGQLSAAGQTTTLTSVGIGVGIIGLVLGVIFLVRRSGIM
jgi:hypothetical protein